MEAIQDILNGILSLKKIDKRKLDTRQIKIYNKEINNNVKKRKVKSKKDLKEAKSKLEKKFPIFDLVNKISKKYSYCKKIYLEKHGSLINVFLLKIVGIPFLLLLCLTELIVSFLCFKEGNCCIFEAEKESEKENELENEKNDFVRNFPIFDPVNRISKTYQYCEKMYLKKYRSLINACLVRMVGIPYLLLLSLTTFIISILFSKEGNFCMSIFFIIIIVVFGIFIRISWKGSQLDKL